MAEHLMIVEPDGATANGFILVNGTTSMTKIADADLPVPSSLAYQDGYFLVSQYDNDQFNLSDSYDGTAWNALQFATAESLRDATVRLISHNRQIWHLGERTTEIWYNSGASVPFDRMPGGILQIGCIGKFSPSNQCGVLIWLGNDYQFHMAKGVQEQVISPVWIEEDMRGLADIWTGYSYQYSQLGHQFYCFRTRASTLQWVFDITTGKWHTRTNNTGENEGAPPVNCYAYYDGKHLVGHPSNGKIYEYDVDAWENDNAVEAVKQIYVPAGRNNSRCQLIELVAESGHLGDESAEGTILLRHSTDRGNSWTSYATRGFGADAEYDKRICWRRRGKSRGSWVFEIKTSSNVRRIFKELWGTFDDGQSRKIPLVTGASEEDIPELDKMICKNLYPFQQEESGEWALRGVPGLSVWANTSYTSECRGLCVMDGYLYAVMGARLYKIDSAGNTTYCNGDDDLDTATGQVFMEINTSMNDENPADDS